MTHIADANERIRIVAINALSGPAASSSASSLQGVHWAVDEINASGGVLDRLFELIELDNRSTPIGSKVAAQQAAEMDVTAIIGPAYSSPALATARVAQKHAIPMIAAIATNPRITQIGNYIFRVCYNDNQQGRVMGRFAFETLQYRNIMTMVNVSSDYSIGLAETFETAFSRHGGIILARSIYKARQPNFKSLIEQAVKTEPDAIFIAGHNESARIILEAAHHGLDAVPLGGDGWDDPSFYEIGGNRIKRGYFTTHWHADIDTLASRQFVQHYGKGRTIGTATALSYDAVKLLADAIRRAGSTRRPDIRQSLAQTKGFNGVTGSISFDKNGDPVKDIIIMQISDGRPHVLKHVHPE
jgi:branched-chain amino acid transport system substrate-binding protein